MGRRVQERESDSPNRQRQVVARSVVDPYTYTENISKLIPFLRCVLRVEQFRFGNSETATMG